MSAALNGNPSLKNNNNHESSVIIDHETGQGIELKTLRYYVDLKADNEFVEDTVLEMTQVDAHDPDNSGDNHDINDDQQASYTGHHLNDDSSNEDKLVQDGQQQVQMKFEDFSGEHEA